MKNTWRISALVLALGVSASVFPAQIQADDSQTFATESGVVVQEIPNPSVNEPSFAEQLAGLKAKYRQDLADYREAERLFVIAKQQNTQLQTLASLEEAVQRTRNVLVARDRVLQTYIEILRLTLNNTRGIELGQKNQSLDDLLSLQQSLRQHEINAESAVDRAKIAQSVTEFASFSQQVQDVTAQAIARISLGNLQEVYDKTQSVKVEVRTQIEKDEQNPFTLAEKKRGFDEIDRNLTELDATLRSFKDDLTKKWERSGQSQLNNYLGNLTNIYSGLSRAISYLDEVLK